MTATHSAPKTVLLHIKKELQGNNIDVPMLPEVAGKVVRISQDADSDASELAKLIQRDQTLAGHVMRIANSALYSPASSMVSLQQAIARLGMRTITEIALAASINSAMFDAPGYEKHIELILQNSLASGLWAKEVARSCRKNVEAAFLAGLLHDIGRPVVVHTSLKKAKTLGLTLEDRDIRALENVLQHSVAIQVLQQWEMPEAVIQVVEYFDKHTEPHSGKTQTQLVVAGAIIAHHLKEHGTEEGSLETLAKNDIFAEVNLYPDEVAELLQRHELIKSAMEAMK